MTGGDLYTQMTAKHKQLLEITQSMLEISAAQKEDLERRDYSGLYSLFSQLENLHSRYETEMADLGSLTEQEYQRKHPIFKQECSQDDPLFTQRAMLGELRTELLNSLQKLQEENHGMYTLLQSQLPQVTEDINLVRKGLKTAGAYREAMTRNTCWVDLYE